MSKQGANIQSVLRSRRELPSCDGRHKEEAEYRAYLCET